MGLEMTWGRGFCLTRHSSKASLFLYHVGDSEVAFAASALTGCISHLDKPLQRETNGLTTLHCLLNKEPRSQITCRVPLQSNPLPHFRKKEKKKTKAGRREGTSLKLIQNTWYLVHGVVART